MQTPKLETKRIFLIATENSELAETCKLTIEKHISASTVFTAQDGAEALFKLENVLPHVAILDRNLAKIDTFDLTEQILRISGDHVVSVILIGEIPPAEKFVDQVVTGQVQFLEKVSDEDRLTRCLSRALNRISVGETSSYRLRFLVPQEVLFEEGDLASSVFFVKKGELEAFKTVDSKKVFIGKVNQGEFVGEMAHFNGEPRSASIRSLQDCELIEIPSGTLDMVLFSKPAWAKALMSTLSRRLKRTNEQVVNNSK